MRIKNRFPMASKTTYALDMSASSMTFSNIQHSIAFQILNFNRTSFASQSIESHNFENFLFTEKHESLMCFHIDAHSAAPPR